MKKLLVLILLVNALQLKAQISIGYFPLNNAFSVTSDPDKLLWVDGRIETNTFFGNIDPELFGMINLHRDSKYSIYSGLSCRFTVSGASEDNDIIAGYSVTAGSRFTPVEKWKKLQIIFELSPYLNNQFNSGLLRAYLGISLKLKTDKTPDLQL